MDISWTKQGQEQPEGPSLILLSPVLKSDRDRGRLPRGIGPWDTLDLREATSGTEDEQGERAFVFCV